MTSEATKRKHVERELEDELPTLALTQTVVQIRGPRGNNLHEALWPDGKTYLVSMPTKFRKHVYIKRGDFVIVDPIEEGDKVKGEICFILLPDHIKHLLEEDNWPKQFKAAAEKKLGNARSSEGDAARASRSHDGDDEDGSDGGDGETNDDWMMMRNPNRMCSEDDDDSSADEDEESS